MLKIDLYNFVPVVAGDREAPVAITASNPKAAAEAIRKSCANQEETFEEWCRLIREHCRIPEDHPYRRLLEGKKVLPADPLWTLGSIAFGTENPWIVFTRIVWPDGKTDFPEKLDKEWAQDQSISH